MLVNGMGCYFPVCSVCLWSGVLVNGIDVSIWDNVLVYRMGC